MTTIPPPSQQFTGIFYNPSFWISSATSLTQSVANTLYLRKTTTDAASALETFNGGISTQTMTAPSLTADVTLFPNQTAGTLKLATTSRSVHCSNIDCQGNAINNASTPANGALSIGGSQTGTGGTISIGVNAVRTGAITIGSNACAVNLGGYITPTYTVFPTSDTQIGYTQTFTIANTTVGTTYTILGTAQNIAIGRWLVQGYCQMPIVSGVDVDLTFNNAASVNVTCVSTSPSSVVNESFVHVSGIVSFTSAQTTWWLYARASLASQALTNIRLVLTRLA